MRLQDVDQKGEHRAPHRDNQRPHKIDWADVAAKVSAELGYESVARFSDRLRMTLMVTTGALRPDDTQDLPFGQPPPDT